MDRNQTESNPIKPVETAGKNQKGTPQHQHRNAGFIRQQHAPFAHLPDESGVPRGRGIAENGAPISESARTGDFLRTLPNRSSALQGQCAVAPKSKPDAGIHFTRRDSRVSSKF
jgi:hypothetical protein